MSDIQATCFGLNCAHPRVPCPRLRWHEGVQQLHEFKRFQGPKYVGMECAGRSTRKHAHVYVNSDCVGGMGRIRLMKLLERGHGTLDLKPGLRLAGGSAPVPATLKHGGTL